MMVNKTFFQAYGKWIIGIAIIALLGFTAWQMKIVQNNTQKEEASVLFDKALAALRQKDAEAVELNTKQLLDSYRQTPYASFAALVLARSYIDQNKMDQAIENLRLAISLTEQGPLEHVARTRLARALASQEKWDDALNALNTKSSIDGYIPLYEEIKGDIFLAKNDLDKARDAYAAALKAVPQGSPVMALQLKQNDLKNKEDL